MSALSEVCADLCASPVLAATWMIHDGAVAALEDCVVGFQEKAAGTSAAEASAREALQSLPQFAPVLCRRPAGGTQQRQLQLKVQSISGKVLAEVTADPAESLAALKQRVQAQTGMEAAQLSDRLVVLDDDAAPLSSLLRGGETLTLLRKSTTLVELLEAAASVVGDIPDAGPAGELLGTEYTKFSLSGMVQVLDAALSVVRSENLPHEIRFFFHPVRLTAAVVRECHVPLMNVASAMHSLQRAAVVSPAELTVVAAMSAFYLEWLPHRTLLEQLAASRKQAERAVLEAAEVRAFAATLPRMTPCLGVEEASATAAAQMVALAEKGLALPGLDQVRLAMDSGGAQLLRSPPAAESKSRLEWAEAAMACQLAPLRPVSFALETIARGIGEAELKRALRAPSPEAVRLLAAVAWAVNPQGDSCWEEVLRGIGSAPELLERLCRWTPLEAGGRLLHVRRVLLEVLDWCLDGCGGDRVLQSLFAWASSAAALSPFVDVWRRLLPVHTAVRDGVVRARSSANPAASQERAWSTALFLLDGHGETWWWLALIRPARHLPPPWIESEDGGVHRQEQCLDAEPAASEDHSPRTSTRTFHRDDWEDRSHTDSEGSHLESPRPEEPESPLRSATG